MVLAHWLAEQLQNTAGDRVELERRWERQIVQWRAQMPLGQKDFPWPGAANYEFPLTPIHEVPVYADFMQTLHAPEDYWTPVARRPDRVEHTTPLREFLTAVNRRWLNMRAVNSRALLDQNILGTAIYKNHWVRERKTVRAYGADGQIERVTKRQSRPLVEPVPLNYFYLPANAWSVDPDAPVGGAQWVAQKFYLTKNELNLRARADYLTPAYDRDEVEKVLKFEVTPDDRIDTLVREQTGFQPFDNEKIEIFEVWARFDVDDDGIDDDIVVTFHLPTLSVLRAIHNPFLHGKRPFHATRYLPTQGFYGRGVSEIDEWAQTALTSLLNALLDNVMVVNTRMYSAPHGASIVPGDVIYPGRIISHQPGEQIRAIEMGEVNPSLPQTMFSLQQWADLASGVGDLRQGDISSLPSRTPAATTMSMLRESNKRFDMILSNFRDTHSEIGIRLLQNIAQDYREEPLEWTQFCLSALGERDASRILEILQTSQTELEETFGITVTATSALVNKEAEKQGFIGMMQVVIPMYEKLVQTSMLMQQMPPGTPAFEAANAAFAGGVELIKRLLERFDIQNPNQYLGNLETIAGALTAQAQGMNPATAGLMPPAFAPYPGAAAPPLGGAQLGSLFGL